MPQYYNKRTKHPKVFIKKMAQPGGIGCTTIKDWEPVIPRLERSSAPYIIP